MRRFAREHVSDSYIEKWIEGHSSAGDGKAAWCGLIIGVGSRDERPEEEGIAHFIEHVIFKGTEKEKPFIS